jgi:hypothetical protein
MMARKFLMYCEIVAAAVLATCAVVSIGAGVVARYAGARHRGNDPIILGIALLVAAAAFGLGAWGLRDAKRSRWLLQLFPAVVVGGILWISWRS